MFHFFSSGLVSHELNELNILPNLLQWELFIFDVEDCQSPMVNNFYIYVVVSNEFKQLAINICLAN